MKFAARGKLSTSHGKIKHRTHLASFSYSQIAIDCEHEVARLTTAIKMHNEEMLLDDDVVVVKDVGDFCGRGTWVGERRLKIEASGET